MKRELAPFEFRSIRLRLVREDDLPMTLAWRNRDDVRRWFKYSEPLTFENHRDFFRKYLERDNDFLLIVEDVNTFEAVGQASVYDVDWEAGSGEVGRFIAAPDFRGKGYMKDACSAIAELAFSVLGLKRVYLEVFPDNERAIHIYLASGYSDCGVKDGMRGMEKVAGGAAR